MTARSAIRRAALVAAEASSSASKVSVLRSARHFATHAESTARQPSVPLQELVHEALSPKTSSSKLLFPTARSAPNTRASDSASLRDSPQPSASAKVPPTAAAETGSNASEATGSKLYDNRALMIIRLIRLNRILSAMTAFMDDVANASRKPFTAAQLESFVVALRIQSKKHSTTRPAPMHSSSLPGDLWRPSALDPSISARTLPISIQCMYAMTTIYDVCIERQIRPTARMTSAMLSSLAGPLDRDQLYKAATDVLANLVPPDASDQASYLRTINHRTLASFINIYGRIGKPELGEQLLARWANAQRDGRQPQHQSLMRADEIIDLSGWGHNAVLWQSLVKARVDADDLEGARKWLDRYRTATRPLERDSTSTLSSRPAVTPEPYLAYLAGIRKRAEVAKLSPTQIKSVSADIQAVVRLMTEGRIPIESSVLAFVVDFEAKVGNLSGAAKLFHELDALRESSDLGDVGLIRAFFNLHRSAANIPSTTDAASGSSSGLSNSTIDGLPSTRLLIRNLVRVGEGHVRTSSENLALCRSRKTLNDALITALVEADYPLVVAVLNLFERWRIIPSRTTYAHVVNALIAQGHGGALFSDRPGLVQAESVQNVDEVLHSLARQGDGQLARIIRQSQGEETPMGEVTVANAQVSSPFRQTQYLIRVLNRVCAAEIENTDPERTVPGWMIKSRKNTDRPKLLTEKGVWRRVRSYMLEAQDETIGTKDQRKDPESAKPLSSSMKAPLLRTEPFLSPRRSQVETASPPPKLGRRTTRRGRSLEQALSNGDKQRYMRMSSARSAAAAAAAVRPSHFRMFSTSAVSRNENGASCDLASASRGDFTHLEPVRTIYIPGFVPYSLGLALQEHLVKQRADARAALRALSDTSSASASTLSGHSSISPSPTQTALESQAAQDTLLLLQHRPVYTEGRRHDTEDTLVSAALRSLGADYHLTKRGGQITYHGPGQLVGYPILNLSSMSLASRCYVDKIQDSLIALLGQRGIPTVPPPEDHTGVWADEYHKIASIGIQVRHRISSHGFALNVEKRAMAGFRHIVACGIVGRNMTCLHDRLDDNGPFAKYNPPIEGQRETEECVESVAQSYKESFAKVFGRRVRDVREDEFEFELTRESERERLRERLRVDVGEEEMVVRGVRVDGRVVRVE